MIRSMNTNLVSNNLNLDAFENRQTNLEKKINVFLLLSKVLKVRRPGRKTSGFRTVRILKICRTSGPDVMSSRALLQMHDLDLPNIFNMLSVKYRQIDPTKMID